MCEVGLLSSDHRSSLLAAPISPGKTRSLDYTPYKPGTGPGGFRTDAAEWPGGGVDSYLDRVVAEVMPVAVQRYGAASHPDLVAFGGSSFGGICTLVAAMRWV